MRVKSKVRTDTWTPMQNVPAALPSALSELSMSSYSRKHRVHLQSTQASAFPGRAASLATASFRGMWW